MGEEPMFWLVLIILGVVIYFVKDSIDTSKFTDNQNSTAINPQNTEHQTGNFTIQSGTLIKYTGHESTVVIPDEVKIIGKDAFKLSRAQSIIIPNSVTEICANAFASQSSLTAITIPASVQTIGYRAFELCFNLEKVVFNGSNPKIASGMFYHCHNLKEVSLPKQMQNIPDNMFEGCSDLCNIYIPNSVKTIGFYAFSGCGFTELAIPYGVVTLESGAFSCCRKLTEITIPNSMTRIESSVFSNCDSLQKITLPDELAFIGNGAFSKCSCLRCIQLPKGVDAIRKGIFSGCTHLESVSIPSAVTMIEENAFERCTNLMHIDLPEQLASIGERAFENCYNLMTIKMPKKLTDIGKFAFNNCQKLESIVIPEGIGNLPYSAFGNCSRLAAVSLPDSLGQIGERAFYECKYLRNICLPNTIREIGKAAFNTCSSLKKITVPASVQRIGENAFAFCSSLTEARIESANTLVDNYAFWNSGRQLAICAPKGSYAESYAQRNSIMFAELDESAHVDEKVLITIADFVVRSNTFMCYFQHNVETIQAYVNVLHRDGSIRQQSVMAAYCKDCDCYYILESSFKLLQKQGVLLCQVITLEELQKKGASVFSNENMKAQSVLRRCGYTVNATDNLSTTQRQQILLQVLDNRVYSASELYNFLDWLINYAGRSTQRNMDSAVKKWTEDRNFVSQYDEDKRRKVQIGSITHRADQ